MDIGHGHFGTQIKDRIDLRTKVIKDRSDHTQLGSEYLNTRHRTVLSRNTVRDSADQR